VLLGTANNATTTTQIATNTTTALPGESQTRYSSTAQRALRLAQGLVREAGEERASTIADGAAATLARLDQPATTGASEPLTGASRRSPSAESDHTPGMCLTEPGIGPGRACSAVRIWNAVQCAPWAALAAVAHTVCYTGCWSPHALGCTVAACSRCSKP
jgi:hypothetical protein